MATRNEGLSRRETERLVLGQLLIDATHLPAVVGFLKDKMFSVKEHQLVYAEILKLYAANRSTKRLQVAHALGETTGSEPTSSLLSALEYAASREDYLPLLEYAEMICDDWKRKETERLFSAAAKEAMNPSKMVDEVAEKCAAAVDSILGDTPDTPTISLYDAAVQQLVATDNAYKNGAKSGFDTGLSFIEELTGPWCGGQLILIGAPTKVGKSALALQCAEGIARSGNVLFYSIEMNAGLIAARAIGKRTGISTMRQRIGAVNGMEYADMVAAVEDMRALKNLHIVSAKLSATQIMDHAKRFRRRRGLVSVFVDHIGIVKPEKGVRSGQDWDLAAAATPILKELAEELNIPVVGISQLLKETPPPAMKMKDKISMCLRRPSYQDLKGAVANDADHVLMPYRPEALLSKIEPSEHSPDRVEWVDAMDKSKDEAGIVLALSRENRWPKSVRVIWDGPTTSFKEIPIEQTGFGAF